MDVNDINNELIDLYREKFNEDYCNKIAAFNESCSDGLKITNPWLLAASNDYCNASKRVMVIGQESYGWNKDFNNGDMIKGVFIPVLMKHYDDFVNIDKGYKDRTSPYWNLYKKLIRSNGKVGFIANNVGKVGYVFKGKGMRGFDASINDALTDIVKREIDICKPDVIICLCSYLYDSHLSKRIGSFNTETVLQGVSKQKFAKLTNEWLDARGIKCYRTYHPAYLIQRNGKKEWSRLIREELVKIVENI